MSDLCLYGSLTDYYTQEPFGDASFPVREAGRIISYLTAANTIRVEDALSDMSWQALCLMTFR